MSKTYNIAVGEEYIETLWIEAENEKEAIEEALRQSSFQQPVYVDTDAIEESPNAKQQ